MVRYKNNYATQRPGKSENKLITSSMTTIWRQNHRAASGQDRQSPAGTKWPRFSAHPIQTRLREGGASIFRRFLARHKLSSLAPATGSKEDRRLPLLRARRPFAVETTSGFCAENPARNADP